MTVQLIWSTGKRLHFILGASEVSGNVQARRTATVSKPQLANLERDPAAPNLWYTDAAAAGGRARPGLGCDEVEPLGALDLVELVHLNERSSTEA